MPNLPQAQTIVQYVTNVSQTQYTFAFYAPLPTDIDVYYQASNVPANPMTQILTYNVDYTVTYNSDPTTGGYITLLAAPTTGYYLTIVLNVAASLNTNFAAAQNFNGANLDAALDRLLLLCQQNQNYALYRNLSYVVNTYLPTAAPYTQLPTLPQNYIWIGSGTGVVAAQNALSPSASLLQSMLANALSGTDGALIVGYYDSLNVASTTVHAALASLQAAVAGLTPFAIKPGMIFDYGAATVPTGYLLCDGSAVSRATYSALFAAIGTTWGSGNGTTTFNVPNLSRRVTLGSGGTATSPAFAGTTVGSTGGEEVHTQQPDEVGVHNHTGTTQVKGSGSQSGFNEPLMTGANDQSVTAQATIPLAIDNNQGSATAFNVMQLGAVVYKIIKT